KQMSLDPTNCGNCSKEYFSTNLNMYLESQFYNNCLNSKISISTKGSIKNCPSMQHEYGNIYSDDLLQVLKNTDLQSFWTITKDNVEICKDCEFRYVCLDCRAIINDTNNKFSKPKNCSYNPYTCSWLKRV
ncbi:MAG: SPASM domain-containing protein, partial [Bacteroidales bacterium]